MMGGVLALLLRLPRILRKNPKNHAKEIVLMRDPVIEAPGWDSDPVSTL